MFSLDIKQSLNPTIEKKAFYGEINTPFFLIQQILSIIPDYIYTKPNLKWLDPGCGCGYFTTVLYNKLYEGLKEAIPNEERRKKHIIQKMIYMVEIQEDNVKQLRTLFGKDANIFHSDFLSWKSKHKFDIIIGNPPYNSHGMKKVPTNHNLEKKQDGKTIWISFVRCSIDLLRQNGHLCFIIPSIWMKPDKARMYHYLTSYNIQKIHCFTNTETNKIFSGEAQTPTCYFLLKKRLNNDSVTLFDKQREKYIKYKLNPEYPIPLFGSHIISQLMPFIEKAGYIKAYKTNTPSSKSHIVPISDDTHSYVNVKTCVLNGLKPQLIRNYSNIPLAYYNKKKLILAHKMYGFPYYDEEGIHGISNRDNYVITDYSDTELKRIQSFLSTYFALYIYETTRYRMKYLEKYAFQFLPDITKLKDFPDTITDESIADYFGLDNEDRENIYKLHQKKYF